MNKVKIFICKRCDHDWASRLDKPMICPKCKSPYWDKDKIVRDDQNPRTSPKD